ncbi:MAG: DUF1211 domain-containing protein [Brevundimonas sp.]|nr:DUF1211 domain-containing protein [Brevundimonas sp.]
MTPRPHAKTHGAERGLTRFEGFSDAVFAITLTLLIVEIKVPGSPQGPQGYTDLVHAMAEQARASGARALLYRHRRLLAAAPLLGADLRPERSLVRRDQPSVPAGDRRRPVPDPHLGLPSRNSVRARRVSGIHNWRRPYRLRLDGQMVLRRGGPTDDGRAARGGFHPADDASLRACRKHPDRRGSDFSLLAADRRGRHPPRGRLLLPAPAEASLPSGRGAEPERRVGRVVVPHCATQTLCSSGAANTAVERLHVALDSKGDRDGQC